ncbi:Holliday junction branch migration protein RuvA [Pararhodospirillum oryzae]|uniref:Holliday junction branch migration complex subunit RuvA n=1 Tax=Pararhodospirillum oryzae TaxID=478448 RepID=A0A512HBT9_9PROT|nr:Holliday junction branch migration protein RuvA [Pararhodospirillum oryzae]GEO82913.1 Holliday junction ATP-dependent DNA helicase RuvA [Pararhodospirillum oryzae]
MIARLRGLVDAVGEDWAVIDVGGVGYLVHCPARVLGRLPPVGEAVALFIETHVREDAISLYGFLEATERAWFRLLATVPGVGAKVALALLSVHSAEALGQAILAQDKAALSRASGVGPKLAARIASELRDRALSVGAGVPVPPAPAGGAARAAPQPVAADAQADALSALVNLGYGRTEAFAAVARAAAEMGPEAPLSALLQGALRDLGRS